MKGGGFMDIAGVSIGLNQANLNNTVQMSVIKMSMDNAESNGNQIVNMIDKMAIDPNKGRIIDATV
ncbi:MAG: putative motility protein [Clostridium butyricum]|nr:putative motility protein [Clostridium butyricum]